MNENERKITDEILERMSEVLEDHEIHSYYCDREKQGICFLKGMEGNYPYAAYFVDFAGDQMVFQMFSPVTPDPEDRERMRDVSEFITRMNYNAVPLGEMKLDFEDGEIAYRINFPMEDGFPSRDFLSHVLEIAMIVQKDFFPGLFEIILKGADAEEVSRKCKEKLMSGMEKAAILHALLDGVDAEEDPMLELTDEEAEETEDLIPFVPAGFGGLHPDLMRRAEDTEEECPEEEHPEEEQTA
ncbi:MAG: hypothetical protein IJH75_00040 [Mogibacterium sp.]|nr:hypothetical protein [Mogibacterium sp.]